MYTFFTSLPRTASSLGLIAVGVLSTLGALSLTRISPVQAQSPGVNVDALIARLDADEATLAALQQKTAPISVSGKDLTISGVNVHIVSGSGSTRDNGALTGLGNLIIGYNAAGNVSGDVRTGSHNLILGDQNNYSSFGGLVAGEDNAISGQDASVLGGFRNTASGNRAVVSGGKSNTATGFDASVGGGISNTASGEKSSVSGGFLLTQINNSGWSGGDDHSP